MIIKRSAIYHHVISEYAYSTLIDIACNGCGDGNDGLIYYHQVNSFYDDYQDDVWAVLREMCVVYGHGYSHHGDCKAVFNLLGELDPVFNDHNSFISTIVSLVIQFLASEIVNDIESCNYPKSFSKWLKDNNLTLSEVDLDQAKYGVYIAGDLITNDDQQSENQDDSNFDDYLWLSDSQYAIMHRNGGNGND